MDGVLVLDKPQGLTSNGALQRVKRLFNAAKAGHTGSLDPLATGVLPLCFGEATKFSQHLLEADKGYVASAKLGVITNSGDADGEVVETRALPEDLTRERLEAVLAQFRGPIEQVPSMFSALKQNGRPLYELARQGIEVERPARPVMIHRLELLGFDGDTFEIDVLCSKGTYIRSLVEDIGLALGCGAHVTALRRTQAGLFDLSHALTLEEIEARLEQGAPAQSLLRPTDVLLDALPIIALNPEQAVSLLQGQPVTLADATPKGLVRVYDADRFIGLAERLPDGRVQPRRLANTAP
ncbi:MAG: tRNA pseudouridine(55) synthase TruB [Gammaproteobacteria bacterium]|nr:tRNA pseudouridine(55) synthase TruB [Gammaproteobacteria bacterium]